MTQTSTIRVYAASVMVPVDQLHPNTYNPNVVPGTIFEEILRDIRKNGFIGAFVVRARAEGGYEISDGEHRYKAAKQLGFKEIPVIVREYDDDTAKANTFRWNHERGYFDAVKTADLIRDLNKRHSLDELSRDLGMTHEEMIQYLRPSDIPGIWNMPVLPNPYSEPTDREPLIFPSILNDMA